MERKLESSDYEEEKKMALSEAKLMEVEQALKENPDFMTQDDHIEEHVKGDYWNGLFNSTQIRGNFYFTREKMIFVSGWSFYPEKRVLLLLKRKHKQVLTSQKPWRFCTAMVFYTEISFM